MAKVSPASIKYMIYASFRSEGPLEKPDVIGAIFGQTEGLLGDDLEMRELQKEGKIGRIEVDLETVDGKSVGEIQIPSALDKSETTLIAAAFETIDRIGPTEAEIKIESIKDVRADKRDFIVDRAKALLERMNGSGQGFEEINQSLKEDTRAAKIQEYGEEKLPAGDLSGKEIIVVEGRADVVNLLKNRVNNVIGMNGTKLPREISRLGEEKEITLFVDGDRGGKLIANNVIENARIKYVANAPDGKEVEELTGKEILMALRKKVDVKDYLRRNGRNFSSSSRVESSSSSISDNSDFDSDAGKKKVREVYETIKGTKGAVLLDSDYDVIRKVNLRDLPGAIKDSRKPVIGVVIEGTATSTVAKACEQANVKILGATNFSSGVEKSNLVVVSL